MVFICGAEVFDDEWHILVAGVGEFGVVSEVEGAIAGGDFLEVEGEVAFEVDVLHVAAADVWSEDAEAFVEKIAIEEIALWAVDHVDDVKVHGEGLAVDGLHEIDVLGGAAGDHPRHRLQGVATVGWSHGVNDAPGGLDHALEGFRSVVFDIAAVPNFAGGAGDVHAAAGADVFGEG